MLICRLVRRVRIEVVPFAEITAVGGEITYKSAENYGVRIKQQTTYILPPARFIGEKSIKKWLPAVPSKNIIDPVQFGTHQIQAIRREKSTSVIQE